MAGRGNPNIKTANKLVLTGSVGQQTPCRMVSALVRSLGQPGVSPQMALKITQQVNELRAELVRMRVEKARRKADELLADQPLFSN